MDGHQDTQVIQGDHHSRDGHYRAKDDVREQLTGGDESRGMEAPDDPGDPTSIQAQNPQALDNAHVKPASEEAAGIPAIWNTMRYGLREMGPVHMAQAFLKINQKDGFDCQSCAWPSPDGNRKLFEFCENGAKAVSDEATQKRITPEFFAKNSIEDLAAQSDYWLNQQGRLTSPMVRLRNASHYTPIEWSVAIELMAAELRALESPNQACFYTSGKTTNEPAFLIQLFARQFGTNNLPDCSNMCHESSGVSMVETLGIGKGTATLEDLENSELIIIFGNNPGTNHPRMLTSLQKAKEHGAKIISVNPMPEVGLMRVINPNPQDYSNPLKLPFALLGKGQALANLHLPVRTNGDIAAIKGILKHLLEEDSAGRVSGIDHEFISRYVDGFDALRADVLASPWDEITGESGLSVEQIRAAGDLCAKSKRTICAWCTGVTQQPNGVENVAMIVNLLLIGGHIGRPGAGTVCVRGHSNVQGDRTMGVWERPPRAFLEALGKEFQFTPPQKWGYDTVECIHAMHDGDVKVFIAISGNFISNTPDTAYTSHAMRRCRLTAHISTKLNRSHLITGEQALILPCLGRSEKDCQADVEQFVTTEDSMGIINASRGFLEPASPHLLSDVAIIARLADATVGSSTAVDWRGMAADYNLIRDAISRVIPGFQNFNTRIATEKMFYLPNAARQRIFKTPTARAKMTVCSIPKHDLGPGELLLITIRTHDQFNSTIYGLNDRYRGIFGGRRVVFLNPADMEESNLVAGQVVDLHSHFKGEVRKAPNFVVVPYGIARRSAAAYYPETNVLVAIGSVAAKSNQPAYKCIRITLHQPASESKTVSLSASAIKQNLTRSVPL